jgi:hypothetical protein
MEVSNFLLQCHPKLFQSSICSSNYTKFWCLQEVKLFELIADDCIGGRILNSKGVEYAFV